MKTDTLMDLGLTGPESDDFISKGLAVCDRREWGTWEECAAVGRALGWPVSAQSKDESRLNLSYLPESEF